MLQITIQTVHKKEKKKMIKRERHDLHWPLMNKLLILINHLIEIDMNMKFRQ